jgi:hypothetical protein
MLSVLLICSFSQGWLKSCRRKEKIYVKSKISISFSCSSSFPLPFIFLYLYNCEHLCILSVVFIQVNITTSTIADTGFIQCVLMCPFTHPGIGCFPRMSISTIRIPTTVLSSSTVQCDLGQMGYFNHARDYNLSVTIEQKDKIDITR